MKIKHFLSLLVALTLVAGATTALAISSFANQDDYVAPAHLIDFNDPVNVAGCTGAFQMTPVHDTAEQAARFVFHDSGSGRCEDPYVNLPLPTGAVDVGKYHYMALLVKTDYAAKAGQMRLRSATTGQHYPFFNFRYADTTDWQLIIIDLSDVARAGAYPKDSVIQGLLTNLRLDPFDNFCDPGVSYYIKAYGLYDSLDNAETFIHFESEVDNTPVLPDIDYSTFWRGEEFAAPSNRYRMNWVDYGFDTNYKIRVDHLLAQGYGGIVSNVNFTPQYLKDEKEFTLLRDVYLYGKEQDMTLWIYDEYQWPSGSAYGQVLDTNNDWRATGIEHISMQLDQPKATLTPREGIDLKVMLARLTVGDTTVDVDLSIESPSFDLTGQYSGKCKLDLYVLRYTDDHEQDRNDFSTLYHVDSLRPDSVDRFIELTHQHYKDSFGKDFSMVEAFFTDEPSQGNRDMENYIVWTEGLDEKFKQTYGYELDLPSLFEGQGEQARLTRIHYYSLVASLFKTSYIDNISEWCEQNGVASSGHLLFEENMNDHVETYGGDFMQIIGGMTVPGVDILWVDPDHLLSDCNIGNHLGIRYVASAARNAGKTDVMIEYNPSAVVTDQFATDKMGSSIGGITLSRLFGTTVYNVINPQHNYSALELNQLNTYIGRLNAILDGTTEAGDLAIFYPIATVQALHNADDVHSSAHGQDTAAVELNANYNKLCLDLLQKRVLYTVIDDQSICAATVTRDGRLVIGNGSYRTIVLAFAQYISPEAAEKLASFKRAGGTVVFVETTYDAFKATTVDGNDRVSAAMAQLSDCDDYTAAMAVNRVPKLASLGMKVTAVDTVTSKQVLYGDFRDAEHDIAYVANSSNLDGGATLQFTDGYNGDYTVYYPMTGMIVTGTGNEVTVDLPAYCAALIVRADNNVTDDTPFESEGEATTPEDSAPDGEQTDGDDTTGGCKSAAAGAALAATVLLGGVALFGKKKKD